MAISPSQIDLWRASTSETPRLEFKAAKNQYDNTKLCEYCVAMANEGGGYLLLGIANDPPRPVVGTLAFNNPNQMANNLFNALGFRVDIEEVAHPDGRVVVFAIPGRPMGMAYHLDGRYLMRLGESLVPMNSEQLKRIHSENQSDWLELIAAEDLTERQVLSLLDATSFFNLLDTPYPSTTSAVTARLIGEGLITNASNGKFNILRIGAVLFAQRMADFGDMLKKRPRVVMYKDSSKLEAELDTTGGKGYAVGFPGLVDYVFDRIPQNEVLEEAVRKEVKLVPKVVIRELLANALIHQDFSMTGISVMVEIFRDRVEFSNPGQPMVPVERFIDGYRSRNERVADLMRRMGTCEERSRGIDQVIKVAEIHQLPPPEFRVTQDRTVAIIYCPKPFDEMTREERVRACYQHCALKQVMRQPMTNQTLRERFQLPESKAAIISQIISATIDAKLVKPDDRYGASKKYAKYLPFWA